MGFFGLVFFVWFGLVWFISYLNQFGSIQFFYFWLMKPNQFFLKNILIDFFHGSVFSVIFFLFSQFNRFVGFLLTPII